MIGNLIYSASMDHVILSRPELHGLRVDDDGEGRRGGAPRAARDGDGEGEAAGRGTVWGEAAATARAISSSLGRAARRSWARAAHSRPAAERLGGETNRQQPLLTSSS